MPSVRPIAALATTPSSPIAAAARQVRADGRVLRVFEHEPDLLAGLDETTADALTARGVARAVRIETGAWSPPSPQRPDHLGLLVIQGLVVRCTSVDGTECPELLGAGDLLRPWDPPASDTEDASWRVLEPLTVAVLDGRFAQLACAHPSVVVALLGRANARARSLSFQLAVSRIRHADARLLLVLWHLAERWGRVTPAGVTLSMPLTHELLARLTGMRRPTASTALQDLIRAGHVEPRGRGRWLLHGPPPDAGALSAA